MFGTYSHIASCMQNAHDVSVENNVLNQESLPAYLRPSLLPRQSLCQGRGKHVLMEDFIMVAEFSELEGPKPLMTIPKDGGANFDKNAFSVRILAVDCQNSAEAFSVSEDAQIVLSDSKTGVFAFVHHMVLYDNTARGFVRPYCIAYITADQQKLMYFYEDLSLQFKKVARYLKYGNRLLFVRDLERHLKDLEYTKNVLLSQASKMRLRNNEEPNGQVKSVRKNAENELYKALHVIQESTMEIKKIFSVVKPLLSNRKLEAHFRLLEESAFQRDSPPGHVSQILKDSWFNDLTVLDELNSMCESVSEPRIFSLALFKPREYKPVLVKTKKARRFNAPLRGLHELCSWGAKEGVRKLQCIHECFRRDMTVLELEKNESRLFYPNSSSISYGQCVAGNFLTSVHMNKFGIAGETEQGWSLLYNYHWGSTGSLDSLTSFKSEISRHSSLSGFQEDSPSAYHTHANMSSHDFQSSPEEELSFLANHEYYFNFENCQDEENIPEKWTDSINLFQTEEFIKEGLLDKTLMSESSDCVQDHDSILAESGDYCENKAEVSSNATITSSQAVSQMIESENSIDLANFAVKTSRLPLVGKNCNLKVEDETANKHPTGILCLKDVQKICKTEKVESLDLLKLENNSVSENKIYVDHPSVVSVSEDLLNKSKTSQAAVMPACILENGGVFTQNLSSQSISEISTHLTVEDSNENSTATKISNFQSQNQHHYAHQITGLTNSSAGDISQNGINYEIMFEKMRAESNSSSVQELYPQVMDVRNISMKDNFPKCGLSEKSGAADVENENAGVTTSYRDGVWKPRCGVYTVGDWINNLTFGRPGFGLSEALSTYKNLEHVIFSLLCGRPVLIVAPAKLEQDVIKLINSLAVFLPEAGRKCQTVLEWTSQSLKISDLVKLKLVGLCRPEKRSTDSFIPSAIKRACTVIDLEERRITAPPYQGQFITVLMSKKKALKSDIQLLSYIEWWLMDILAKAFLFFHTFCLGSAGSILYSHSPNDQRDAYCATIAALMAQLGVKDDDSEIIGYLVEMVKLSELEPHVWHDEDAERVVQPLTLQYKTCEKFRC